MGLDAYRPENLVSLPARDAAEALLLATRFATAAEEYLKSQKEEPEARHKGKGKLPDPALPGPLHSALHDVTTKRGELESLGPRPAKKPATVRAADKEEDNAVGAYADWNRSFLRLPAGDPARIEASAIFTAVFGDGDLTFLKIRPSKEWVEVEKRLVVLNSMEARIVALGGRPFLHHLRATHEAYGVAVGATKLPEKEEPPQVRTRTAALLDAMRVYVVRVSGSIDAQDSESERRASALLKPLSEWDVESSGVAKTEHATEPAPTAAAGGDAKPEK